MMRSLFSGVAGLKTHQTRMDVIGNNIANVNTVGFKGSAANFADTFYQTMSGATGPNATMGTAGTNAKQIGLGSQVAAIQVNITEQGGYSTTNRALDVAINGESFMIVSANGETRFTKSGAMNVDEAGNLYCTTNGATMMGWYADDDGNIVKNTAQPLKVMGADNLYYEPEATEEVTLTGNIDPNDPDVSVSYDGGVPKNGGEVMTFSFYNNIGELYTAKLRITKNPTQTGGKATYDVRIEDIVDQNSESIFVIKTVAADGTVTYGPSSCEVHFGGSTYKAEAADVDTRTGKCELVPKKDRLQQLSFTNSSGVFNEVAARTNNEYTGKALNFYVVGPVPITNGNQRQNGTDNSGDKSPFPQTDPATDKGGLNIWFNSLSQFSQGGTSKLSYERGHDGYKAGCAAGNMTGISVDKEGKIWGSYNNGMKKCLAQLAVATFSNPSGLEEVGNSLFAASLNSGLFNGVGEEILLTGSFTVGALEMSNVDLANEFTTMIITQRGFQANSRIITTSDSILEELVNLKR